MSRVRWVLIAAFTAAALAAGCSGVRIPTADDLIPQAPKFELKTMPSNPALRALGPPALIGPEGSCSAASGEFPGAGIALEMSECDVVQRAGPPDNIDISANARGERIAVLTYGRGERPGIYRFVAGRLVSIERGPEPPAPERPAKKAKARPRA
jgi:hypothetical protein